MHVLSLLAAASLARAYTVTNVGFLMFKNIDPIVYPGQYVSHMHSFFGSDAVNVNTTTSAELREGCATALNPNDFSTYWVPTLYVVNNTKNETHTPVAPMRFSAYYENLNAAEIAFPEDYQVVAGNASATAQEHVTGTVSWFCEGEPLEDNDAAAFPTKTCKTHLQTLLWFPDCTNPETFESAYSRNPDWFEGYGENRCPHGMFRIPQLRFSIRYDVRKLIPEGWEGQPPLTLACGSSYCSHGDFINGWATDAAEYMLEDPSKRDYFAIKGALGSGDQGSTCTTTPEDSDPDHGTGDYLESLRMKNSTVLVPVTQNITARSSNMHRRHSHHHRL